MVLMLPSYHLAVLLEGSSDTATNTDALGFTFLRTKNIGRIENRRMRYQKISDHKFGFVVAIVLILSLYEGPLLFFPFGLTFKTTRTLRHHASKETIECNEHKE